MLFHDVKHRLNARVNYISDSNPFTNPVKKKLWFFENKNNTFRYKLKSQVTRRWSRPKSDVFQNRLGNLFSRVRFVRFIVLCGEQFSTKTTRHRTGQTLIKNQKVVASRSKSRFRPKRLFSYRFTLRLVRFTERSSERVKCLITIFIIFHSGIRHFRDE